MCKSKQKNPAVFIGLDLSLTGTGVVVLDKKGDVLHSETIKTKTKGMKRLQIIRDIISDITVKYPKGTYCIENYSMGSRAGQAFSIGELGGVIKLLLFEWNIEPILVPPTRLKKFITGGGRAEKDMIILNVYKRWGFEPKDNNIADAYGLSQIARSLKIESIELNKAQNEVIQDILNPPEPKKKKK